MELLSSTGLVPHGVVFGSSGGARSVRGVERVPFAYLIRIRKRSPLQLIAKRVIDLTVASVALAVLSPLLIVVALMVKLTSPGPVFFKQTRVGIGGKLFTMYKFRSMVCDAEEKLSELQGQNEKDGPIFKMRHDPRVTRVGRWIRKYSLDEFPQLWNVIRNDMSLVGPRPPIPAEVSQYSRDDWQRLSVLPGLTCLWQIAGRSDLSFEQWMELDRAYIHQWSLGLDIKIFLKTFKVVMFPKGSY